MISFASALLKLHSSYITMNELQPSAFCLFNQQKTCDSAREIWGDIRTT